MLREILIKKAGAHFMLAELAGFTLTRVIPDRVLLGVLSGAYKICGGVVRDHSGQIIAHLVQGAGVAMNPLSSIVEALNSVQLYRIGRAVGELKDSVAAIQSLTTQLVTLAQGTAALSGLTLAVSAANFVFLSRRLSAIDQKLGAIAQDVKSIKAFLQSQEKASLTTALKTLSSLDPGLDDKTRIPLLLDARQRLGEVHHRYRDQLAEVMKVEEVLGIEEYFSVTALGHALCSAELDMQSAAVSDLRESFSIWQASTRRIASDLVLRQDPQRLLASGYAPLAKAEEIVDWMDFANDTEKGIEWIDRLRERQTSFALPQIRIPESERTGMELMRKFASRNRIYQGYLPQYEYLEQQGLRPSAVDEFIGALDPSMRVQDCFVLIAQPQL